MQDDFEQSFEDSDIGTTYDELEDTQDGGGATSSEQAPGEVEIDKVDPNSLPPELVPIYKSMQRDYTRKTQQLAEKEKELAWALELQELARTNPQAARDLLLTIASHLSPSGQTETPTPTAQMPEELEFESDAVKQLWERSMMLEQELAQARQLLQATVQHAFTEELDKQLSDIEREFGEFDKEELLEQAKSRPGMSLRDVFILTHYPELIKRASQGAYKTQAVKRQANPLQSQAPSKAQQSQATTLEEAFQLALRDLGLNA